MSNFTFTRVPSTKVAVSVVESGLVSADNTIVIIGRRAASGGSATNNVPVLINNYGDPVAVVAEAAGLFGTASEIGGMIVAAINAIKGSDLGNIAYPPILAICMANAATNASLAACLAANVQLPMPFVTTPFAITDSTASAALSAHLTLISGSDRGANGQFGSFGIMGSQDTTSNTTTASIALALQNILVPWLRDASAGNTTPNINAAAMAVFAANGVPYLPLNDIKIGGLVAPAAATDWHTSGDSGTIALGLTGGVIPLYVGASGEMRISRAVTALRTVSGTPDSSYYDLQDWQKLYYFRANAYNLAQQPRYKVAHATDAKLLALKSEIIALAKDFEVLEMFQHVDELVKLFTVTRPEGNRYAAVYYAPSNVVPGFHNKGIDIVGTSLFDTLSL